MRITPNTTLDELLHSDEAYEEELYHIAKKTAPRKDHKYLKREWKNGRWKYYYDFASAKKDRKTAINNKINQWKNNVKVGADKIKADVKTEAKKTTDKAVDATLKRTNENAAKLNKLVDKAKEVVNKLYDDPKNMYDVTTSSYKEKMEKVKETKEWKEIVAKQDPEYVKKNADGTTSYLIDDYVVKKKHPVLDIVSDIAAGRKVDVNEITKESTVAGLKEWAFGTIRTGAVAVGVAATVFTEKFKLQQGSYDDDIKKLADSIDKGSNYTKEIVGEVSKVTPEDVERMATAVKAGSMAAEAKRTINEGNVIKAAQLVLESDMVQNNVGDNKYVEAIEDVYGSLSDEEIAALNLLLKQMRK